jgi:chaperonin cofactor prefoldin
MRPVSSRAISELRTAVEQLDLRMSRLEGHQQRFQDDAMVQQRRTDAVAEDIVAALDVLRRRVEDLEDAQRG